MILLDYSQIALSNIIVQKLNDESMIRHMILNSIRMYNKRYRDEYGQMVICADGMNTWRKDYFPYYKAKRRKNRDSSDQDWNEIFRILHLVRDEIKENLPYKVLHMEGVEADDIIASLVLQSQEFGMNEPMMIVSSDKDFIQLQKFNNVKQFSPIQKKFVKDDNPRTYLFNHIMKGDTGDGIPNVLSADDTFVTDKTQSPLRKTRIAEWLENSDNLREVMDDEIYRNYQRNKKLIDLTEVPEPIQQNIINNYNEQKVAMKMRVLNYLIKKRCNQLIEVVEEFYNNEKIIA
tara:strand:- start:1755 stop:2624 length:870 start_codon:yes stop_codon:yes gene_type:complete